MTAAPLQRLVRELRRSAATRRLDHSTDAELLELFRKSGDPDAFETIVRRYGGVVYAACRKILASEADAEDAFQATFLVLLRNPAAIRKRTALAAWLCGVAHRVSLKALAAAVRRRRAERRKLPPSPTAPDLSWREACAIVHEELDQLPEVYRLPLLLCYLEDQSRDEAARQLGVSLDVLRGRLERGRERFRARLVKRGVTLTAGLLAAVAGPGRAEGPPQSWIGATRTAAANGRIPSAVANLIQGIMPSMTRGKIQLLTLFLPGLVLGLVGLRMYGAPPLQAVARADAPQEARPDQPADAERLAGTWLFESAANGSGSQRFLIWTSKVTVSGNAFNLSDIAGLPKNLKGTFALDPRASPKQVDLKVEAFELSGDMKVAAGTLPGIYKLSGDRLTVCLASQPDRPRPAAFDTAGGNILLELAKAPEGFKGFPGELTVKVSDPDGKPAPGVDVASFMDLRDDLDGKGAKREWGYRNSTKTGADGTARLPFAQLRATPVIARDWVNKRMALPDFSPASLCKGELNLTLRPECHVTGTIVCDELKKAGKPIGRTNVQLSLQSGRRAEACVSWRGTFEFVVPPGTYKLHVAGADVNGKSVTLTVPEGRAEFTPEHVALEARRLSLLRGQPAPELDGVAGWKGAKVRLADLRGKYVLLDFWGYWNGQSPPGHMPILMELHERFAGKGLAIIGVHVDRDGEVDTAAKLDEKVAAVRKKLWKDKDIPFPVALTSGKPVGKEEARRGPAAEYGVHTYPTAVLIDRGGRVVGQFAFGDAKSAVEVVEKILSKK